MGGARRGEGNTLRGERGKGGGSVPSKAAFLNILRELKKKELGGREIFPNREKADDGK